MKKNVFVLALMCCLAMMAQAQVAKYCMNYNDFVNGNWKSVDELTQGRSQQACRMKAYNNKYFYFRTGDKMTDKVLKKEAFAVMYGGNLYVNCRNLRHNGVQLDVTGYTQAMRYDNDKVCVIAYKNNDTTTLLGIGLMVAGCVVDSKALSIGLECGSSAAFITNSFLSRSVCYLVDHDANEKGLFDATRMNDQYMENLLNGDAPLLQKYKAVTNKHNRQASANVLPILMEKGLVAMNSAN